jgi:hypothetical protein
MEGLPTIQDLGTWEVEILVGNARQVHFLK